MNVNLKKSALISILLATASFVQSIQLENKGIQISAHAISSEECLSTFYRNIHEDRIFPVAINIKNNTQKAITLSPEDIIIEGAKLLTPQALESQIFTMHGTAAFMTIIFFPVGLFTYYQITQLKNIQPIICQNSIPDRKTTIEPGQTFQTMLFAQFDYPKDIDGKSQDFIAPQALDISLTFKNDKFLLFQSKTVLNINVPIS